MQVRSDSNSFPVARGVEWGWPLSPTLPASVLPTVMDMPAITETTVSRGSNWILWLIQLLVKSGVHEVCHNPECDEKKYCSILARHQAQTKVVVRLDCDSEHLSDGEIREHIRALNKIGMQLSFEAETRKAFFLPFA